MNVKNKEITLNNPLVFDVQKSVAKIVNQFSSVEEFKKWMKTNFNYDKWPYNGKHRYGNDSTTDISDITYNMLEVGMELLCHLKPKGYPKADWFPIRVIHKYHNVVFYQCLVDDYISFIDCGGDDYDWRKFHEKFEPALPTNSFIPIEVLTPNYVDVKPWHLPKIVKITEYK